MPFYGVQKGPASFKERKKPFLLCTSLLTPSSPPSLPLPILYPFFPSLFAPSSLAPLLSFLLFPLPPCLSTLPSPSSPSPSLLRHSSSTRLHSLHLLLSSPTTTNILANSMYLSAYTICSI